MSTGEKDTSEVLGTLQDKGDLFTKMSVVERKRQADLEDAVAHISAEAEKYRAKAKNAAIDVMNLHVLTPNPAYSRADGVNVGKEAQQVTMKALNVLEAKLNKLLQRKSEVINQNKQIKLEIDHFRRLRLQTDISHAKFEQLLAECKESIERMLGESGAIVEERDRLLDKKEGLERTNLDEQRIFQEEYEDMGAFIKKQNMALEEALLKERKQNNGEKKNGGGLDTSTTEKRQGDLTLEDEIDMARQVGTLTNFVLNEQSSLSGIQEKINDYEMMFEQLKRMTGSSSLDEVVSNYVAQEEDMFSLYNFIQTVNGEIDAVLESTGQIEVDIQLYKEAQKKQDDQRNSALDELRHRKDSTLELTRMCEEDNKHHSECVAQISKKVSSVFFKVQCDQMDNKGSQSTATNTKSSKTSTSTSRPEGKIALLINQGVSESNVLEYMGCIEQRAVDIISEYLRVHVTDASAQVQGARSPTPGPPSPMHWPTEPIVDFAEFTEDDMDNGNPLGGLLGPAAQDESDSKPVDLSQFKDKLQKKLGIAPGTVGLKEAGKASSGGLSASLNKQRTMNNLHK